MKENGAVICVHDHGKEEVHSDHSNDGRGKEDFSRLCFYFFCEECRGGAESFQILKDVAVVQDVEMLLV